MASSSSTPEPIVVLYKSSVCRHCQNLTNIWDSVTKTLKEVHPKLRFHVLTAKDNTGKFDENIAPKDLIRYGKWYPMILLIPGRTWDNAMANLGPKNPIEIKDGVQVMNAVWENGNISYVQKYDIRKPDEFAKWLREAFENEDFKRVQFASSGGSVVAVPTIQTPSQPIPSILSSIVKPSNTSTSYVASGSSDRHSSMEPGSDICSMRIISRPK